MTWQPIKTAPRDGQFFIGANVEEAIICNWPKQAKIDYAPGNWKRGGGKEWDGSIIPTKSSLTHWQPLPDLPQIVANLSPAAQAVLDAVCDNTESDCDTQHLIAAALRAVADLELQQPWPTSIAGCGGRWMRDQLLAIADELEGQDQLAKQSD